VSEIQNKVQELDEELEHYALKMSKIRHKKYEFFVVSRILHRLDDPEIEFVTQQLVRTEKGRFLLDLFFPQFSLAIEVDEPYHSSTHQVESDEKRDKAIVDSAQIEMVRITIKDKSMGAVLSQIEEVIERIRGLKLAKSHAGDFEPFVFGQHSDVGYWLEQGTIRIDSGAMFRTHVDVARIFGKHYRGHQSALINLPSGDTVWFPKLYENGDWNNQLSADGETIVMERLDGGRYEAKGDLSGNIYVFAHHTDELGKTFYSFKGIFERSSTTDSKTVFKRVALGFNFDGEGCLSAFS